MMHMIQAGEAAKCVWTSQPSSGQVFQANENYLVDLVLNSPLRATHMARLSNLLCIESISKATILEYFLDTDMHKVLYMCGPTIIDFLDTEYSFDD